MAMHVPVMMKRYNQTTHLAQKGTFDFVLYVDDRVVSIRPSNYSPDPSDSGGRLRWPAIKINKTQALRKAQLDESHAGVSCA